MGGDVLEGLAQARAQLGEIDAGLLDLLNRRARIVAALHAKKRAAGLPVFDGARTDAILDGLVARNPGPLRSDQVRALFAFLLHHYALEHRPAESAPGPGDRAFEPPFLVCGPLHADRIDDAARCIARHGIRCLRNPEGADPAPARAACDAHGLMLLVSVPGADARALEAAAGVADVVQTPGPVTAPAAAALARRGRAVVLRGGSAEAAAALRAAGVARVGVSRRRGEPGAGSPGGDVPILPDLRGLRDSQRTGAVLGALASGASGAMIDLADEDYDDELLADLAFRAARLCVALAPWPGATGGTREGS